MRNGFCRSCPNVSDEANSSNSIETSLFDMEASKCNCMHEMGTIQKILAHKTNKNGNISFFVKFCGKSYRNCSWVTENSIKKSITNKEVIEKYLKTYKNSPPIEPYYNNQYEIPNRIVSSRCSKTLREFLIVWSCLPVTEASWENESSINEKQLIDDFLKIEKLGNLSILDPIVFDGNLKISGRKAKNNDSLINPNHLNDLSFILTKKVVYPGVWLSTEPLNDQFFSISLFVRQIVSEAPLCDPILLITSKLSSSLWMKEMNQWENLSVLNFIGTDNECIFMAKYEMFFGESQNPKFHVLISSLEQLLKWKEKLDFLNWKCIIYDNYSIKSINGLREIHGIKAFFRVVLSSYDPYDFQTNQLIYQFINSQGLLNDSHTCKLSNEEKAFNIFSDLFGRIKVRRCLQKFPNHSYIQESIFLCDLSQYQKNNYPLVLYKFKTTLENSTNIQEVKKVLSDLKRVVNHPFLLCGAEENIMESSELSDHNDITGNQSLVSSSGKLVVLDKILSLMIKQRKRIVILCSSKRMLDIIQDYLSFMRYRFERIDGQTRGDRRQASIDGFNENGSNIFVFMLCLKEIANDVMIRNPDAIISFNSDFDYSKEIHLIRKCIINDNSENIQFIRLVTTNSFECALALFYVMNFYVSNPLFKPEEIDQDLNNISALLNVKCDILSMFDGFTSKRNLFDSDLVIQHSLNEEMFISSIHGFQDEDKKSRGQSIIYCEFFPEVSLNKKLLLTLFQFCLKYGIDRVSDFVLFSDNSQNSETVFACIAEVFIKWLMEGNDDDGLFLFNGVKSKPNNTFQELFSKEWKQSLFPDIIKNSKPRIQKLHVLRMAHIISSGNSMYPDFCIDSHIPAPWWCHEYDLFLMRHLNTEGFQFGSIIFKNHENDEIRSLSQRCNYLAQSYYMLFKQYVKLTDRNDVEFSPSMITNSCQLIPLSIHNKIIDSLLDFGYPNFESWIAFSQVKGINNDLLKRYITLIIETSQYLVSKSGHFYILNHYISGEIMATITNRLNKFETWRNLIQSDEFNFLEIIISKGINEAKSSEYMKKTMMGDFLTVDQFIERVEQEISCVKSNKKNPKLPIKIGSTLLICSFGEIINKEGYHNNRYYYCPGYVSERLFSSIINPNEKAWYRSMIIDGGDKPIFRVELKENPEIHFEANVPSNPWLAVMRALDVKKKKLGLPAGRSLTVSGPEFFGLSSHIVLEEMQRMANSTIGFCICKNLIETNKSRVRNARATTKSVSESEPEPASESENSNSESNQHDIGYETSVNEFLMISPRVNKNLQKCFSLNIDFSNLIGMESNKEIYIPICKGNSRIKRYIESSK